MLNRKERCERKDIPQITYFLHLADTLNFTEAERAGTGALTGNTEPDIYGYGYGDVYVVSCRVGRTAICLV